MIFQSTLPTRGSDNRADLEKWVRRFQSTLPTRGSEYWAYHQSARRSISIHAPHEGERLIHLIPCQRVSVISIHAPHEGERPPYGAWLSAVDTFQSTLPTRGSDFLPIKSLDKCRNFNPRSPRGGATAAGVRYCDETEISIHAPHEGERRSEARRANARIRISIHAPHEGERPGGDYTKEDYSGFQSTLPTRGSDVFCPL